MTAHDLAIVTLWFQIATILAAIGATAIPILYAFAPWWSRAIGRLFMAQAVAVALALDRVVLFIFWRPNVIVRTALNGLIISLIAGAVWTMAIYIWRLQRPNQMARRKKNEPQKQDVRYSPGYRADLPAWPGDPVRDAEPPVAPPCD